MSDALTNNYSINSEYVTRHASAGRQMLGQMLAGPIGQIVVYKLDPTESKGFVQGNKYRITKTPEGEKPSYTQYVKLK